MEKVLTSFQNLSPPNGPQIPRLLALLATFLPQSFSLFSQSSFFPSTGHLLLAVYLLSFPCQQTKTFPHLPSLIIHNPTSHSCCLHFPIFHFPSSFVFPISWLKLFLARIVIFNDFMEIGSTQHTMYQF